MSFIVGALVGVAASGVIKGIGAMGQARNVASGKAAAYDIYQDKLGLLGQQKGTAKEQAELGYSGALSQYAGGLRDITMGTQMGMRGIQESSAVAVGETNLATSGTIEQKAKIQTGDIMAKYKSDMQKLVESRELAGKQRDINLAKSDYAYRGGKMSAEEAYQNTLTGFSSTPTTFMEGFFS